MCPDPKWRAASVPDCGFCLCVDTGDASPTPGERRAAWKGKPLPVLSSQPSGAYGHGGEAGALSCLVLSRRKWPFRTLDRSVNHEKKERNGSAGFRGGGAWTMMAACPHIQELRFLRAGPADPGPPRSWGGAGVPEDGPEPAGPTVAVPHRIHKLVLGLKGCIPLPAWAQLQLPHSCSI